MSNRDNNLDIIAPRVLIVPVQNGCPIVSGAEVKGMLNISGTYLYYVSNNAGTWQRLSGAGAIA